MTAHFIKQETTFPEISNNRFLTDYKYYSLIFKLSIAGNAHTQ